MRFDTLSYSTCNYCFLQCLDIFKGVNVKKHLSIAASAVLALTMAGCGSDEEQPTVDAIAFSSVALSANDTEKQEMRVSDTISVTYSDGSSKDYPLTFKTLMKMGDVIGTGTIGLMTDKDGVPLLKTDGSNDISDGPDGNSLINVGNKTYMVTHMEEAPGSLYNTEVKVENGELVAVETAPVDLSAMGGTIINCASTKTTYGTHLGGEEDYALNSIFADAASPFYVDCALDGTGNDAGGIGNSFCGYVDGMNKYLSDATIDKANGYNGTTFSPYNYGYIVEVEPLADGTTNSAKHYVTGKYTPELAAMMPDGKTVYMSDDGTAKGLWKFVSDAKIDGFKADWEGTLYAAKANQTSTINGGSFDLTWIKLGHAKDSEVKALIDAKMKLTDIFQIAAPVAGVCDPGFTSVYEDSTLECLKLVPGQETAAAFLETRKYAAYMGATIEFRKEEGLTYDPDRNSLYIAMSEIAKSMEDNYNGTEPANHIRLAKNSCGAVYEMALDANYSGTKMEAIAVGSPLVVGEPYADEWTCSPEGISNPDNITYIGHNTLLISEDTTKHVNNMSWAYNTVDKSMTRIASLPIGGEVTGVDKGVVSGKGFLFINQQHPFKDNPKAADGTTPNSALITGATAEQLRALVGYIDGIPAEVLK